MALTDRHFAGLLAVRNDLAAFERVAESDARTLGLTHAQHHVLLTLRSHPHPVGPRIADVARALGIASPSAVELVARLSRAGLLDRVRDPTDRRATRLRLSTSGENAVRRLSEKHLPRLRELTNRARTLLAD